MHDFSDPLNQNNQPDRPDEPSESDMQPQTPSQRRASWAGLQAKAEEYVRYRNPALRDSLATEIFEALMRDAESIAYNRLPRNLQNAERARTVGQDAAASLFSRHPFSFFLQPGAVKFESDSHMRAYFKATIKNKLEDYNRKEKWALQPPAPTGSDQDQIQTFEPGQPRDNSWDGVPGIMGGEQGDETDLEKLLQIKALRRLMQTELNPDTELPVLLQDLYGDPAIYADNAALLDLGPPPLQKQPGQKRRIVRHRAEPLQNQVGSSPGQTQKSLPRPAQPERQRQRQPYRQ